MSASTIDEATGAQLTLRFDGAKCIHARFCVLGLPKVFRANVKGPWLDPDGARADEIAEVAHNCPSGAITYERRDGGPAEAAPEVNLARLRENGPLAFHGALSVGGAEIVYRATLCRCGASRNKPYCDGSHGAAGFTASGEPASQESPPLAARDGAIAVNPLADGPLQVLGHLEIVSGTGHTITRTEETYLCRCGHSQNKPFCDGAHATAGFQAPGA